MIYEVNIGQDEQFNTHLSLRVPSLRYGYFWRPYSSAGLVLMTCEQGATFGDLNSKLMKELKSPPPP